MLTSAFHKARCDCGCVPAVPSLHEMAELRATLRSQRARSGSQVGNSAEGSGAVADGDSSTSAPGVDCTSRVGSLCQTTPVSQLARGADGCPAGGPGADLAPFDAACGRLEELQAERKQLRKVIARERATRAACLALHEPGALEAERRVLLRLPGGDVQVDIAQDAALAQGGLLWSAGVALAEELPRRLAHLVPAREGGRQPRVVELGCGAAALPALVAARMGAQVVATDVDVSVVDLARANAARNAAVAAWAASEGSAEAAGVRVGFGNLVFDQLAWGAPWRSQAQAGEFFDVALAADVLYDPAAHEGLCQTVAALVRPGGLLLLAFPERDPPSEAAFLDMVQVSGFSSPPRVDLSASHQGQSPVWLLELTRDGPAGACSGRVVEPPRVRGEAFEALVAGLYL